MWQEEMIGILRVMIWDMETSPKYSDERLEKIIVAAGKFVNEDLGFDINFVCDIIVPDITPDPTDDETRDENFINLTILKAACIIDKGAASLAAGQAGLVKDGPSNIDLRDIWKARMTLLDKGMCKEYEEAADQYLIGSNSTPVGAAVLSPFRVWSGIYYPQQFLRN